MIYDNSKIRRQDRLLDKERASEILKEGEYGVLSMATENGGYGIPINYVFDESRECLYFHCAPEGEKLRCIAMDNRVSFCIVGKTKVAPSKFTTAYESIVIRGKTEADLPAEERMHALELILDKYSPNDKTTGMKYAEKSFHRTRILRLDIQQISGKSKKIR
ncbi:MAG TPA: pyridoxamine 5'-phosphate oxidase family protein [Candidatus Avirikenella pullistercoris]|nr:pyridoxamine 5'-phosphate oxidase family protein [Candidatus Avirikenella pullistercoris]